MASLGNRLDPKKELLLKAVVKEYIHTASPVASLMLGGHHGLEASSATLRNWMSELEHLGYLKQRHTSSGRIPTDLGYRHYVDLLMSKENLTAREKRVINKVLETGFREIEDLIAQAAEIVSFIGKCIALVLPPVNHNFILKSLQLVPVEENKVLLVLLTQSGLVFDRVVDIECSNERLQTLSNLLNQKLKGASLSKIGPHVLDGIADHMLADLFAKVVDLITQTFQEENKNRVLVEGTHHLLDQPEFHDLDKLRSTLEVFKKENHLSRFLGKIGAQADVNILIGVENPLKDFQELSVIAAPYGVGSNWVGTFALVGPTRMDYDHLVPLIQYTASVLSNRLEQLLG